MEGRKNNEGMSGISPPFIVNALKMAAGEKETGGCLDPLDVIRALRYSVEHHPGFTQEEKNRYLERLTGERDSVLSEYLDTARKEVRLWKDEEHEFLP